MRVLIVTSVYYPEHFLINSLSEYLGESDIEVEVLTGLPNYPKGKLFEGFSLFTGPFKEEHSKNVTITRMPVFPRGSGNLRLILNYLSFVVFGVLSIFRCKKADVVFCFGTSPITTIIPGIFISKLQKVPLVLWLQDLWPESLEAVGICRKGSKLYQMVGFMVQWIYSNIDLVMMQSKFFNKNLDEYNFKGKREYVPNWGESLKFESKVQNFKFDEHKNKFVVSFAGNIGKAQAVDTLIQVFRNLKDNNSVSFVVAGEGSEFSKLSSIVAEEGLVNVHLLGRRPFDEMGDLFQNSDALLVTLKGEEAFNYTIPAKVQQYFSAGKPVVCATGEAGNTIVLEAGAGVVSSPEDAKSISKSIISLMNKSLDERQLMGFNGKKYFDAHFGKLKSLDRIVESLKRIGNEYEK